MKISIALASYNGEVYIKEQIKSLETQTVQPDEVIICDDASTDNTVCIIEEQARTTNLDIFCHTSSDNLGYARNFERALSLCTGDIIFLCDQDDIWEPQKIETIIDIFRENTRLMMVINDQEIVKEDLTRTGFTSLGQLKSSGYSERLYDLGCCMALRRSLIDLALPIPCDLVAHDTWLNRIALSINQRFVFNGALQLYRRHSKTVTGTSGAAPSNVMRAGRFARKYECENGIQMKGYKQAITVLNALLVRFDERLFEWVNSQNREFEVREAVLAVKREIRALDSRVKLMEQGKFGRRVSAVRMYLKGDYKYFRGHLSFLKDVFM